MSISPILLNGVISRVQDISVIKQNEDQKPIIDQQNAQTQFAKELNDKREQVIQKDDARYGNRKFDAREKGDNEYDRGKNPNKKAPNKDKSKKKKEDGKVTVKGEGTSFDVSI